MMTEFDKSFRRAQVIKKILEEYAEITGMDISPLGVMIHINCFDRNLLLKLRELKFKINISSSGGLVASRPYYTIFLS